MSVHEFSPGRIGHVPAFDFSSKKGKPTLTVFLHPQCPCSEATVTQLQALPLSNFKTRIYFYRPAQESATWFKSRLWKRASELSAAILIDDVGGVEAERYGATTSGTVEVFDGISNRLEFFGGLTPSRGATGESPGFRAIKAIAGGAHSLVQAPVFGCAIIPSRVVGSS